MEEHIPQTSAKGIISGWMICRMHDDSHVINNLVYGQFSEMNLPPKDGWVYMASQNTILSNHFNASEDEKVLDDLRDAEFLKWMENNAQSSAEENDGLDQHKNLSNKLLVEAGYENDHSVQSTLRKSVQEKDDWNTLIHFNKIRYFQVTQSIIPHINGKYVECGYHNGVPMFRNVRGWLLLRTQLEEIPELGILADSTYELSHGSASLSSLFHKLADRGNHDIISRTSTIKEGSHSFKHKFINISRAGIRMINADQSIQSEFDNEARARLRSKNSQLLVEKLQQMTLSEEYSMDPSIDHDVLATKNNKNSPWNEIDIFQTTANRSSKRIENDASFRTAHINHETDEGVSVHSNTNESQTSYLSDVLLSETELETQLSLQRNIIYQHGSQGLLPGTDQSEPYLSAESEMSLEVTKCIENRERALMRLKLIGDKLRQMYVDSMDLSSTNLTTSTNLSNSLKDLFSQMNLVRLCTIDFAESLGAWARLIHKGKKRNELKTVNTFGHNNDPRSKRKYCVLVAFKTVEDLYPPSAPVVSTNKRFSRGFEPAKKGTERKLVGIYDTRDEAILAFEKAFEAIPLERMLLEDKESKSKMFMAMRSCGKHYIIRSSGVPADLPCEQCELEHMQRVIPLHSIPDIFDAPISQFIYKGENYLEKVWNDINFLDDVQLLKMALPDDEFASNPLLLSTQSLEEMLKQLHQHFNPHDLTQNPNPIQSLRGKVEQLENAKRLGLKYNHQKDVEKFENEYYYNPYVTTYRKELKNSLTEGLIGSKQLKMSKTITLMPPINPDKKGIQTSTASNFPLINTFPNRNVKTAPMSLIQSSSPSDGRSLYKSWNRLLPILEGKLAHHTTMEDEENINSSGSNYRPNTNSSPNRPFSRSNRDSLTDLGPLCYQDIPRSINDEDRSNAFNFKRLLRALYILGQASKLDQHRIKQTISSEIIDYQQANVVDSLDYLYNTIRSDFTSSGNSSMRAKSSKMKTLANTFIAPKVVNKAVPSHKVSKKKFDMNNPNTIKHRQSAQSTATVTIAKSSDGKQNDVFVAVEAYYGEKGAEIAQTQFRLPLANRTDDIFCRTDVGEWAGLTKGRAMRAYEFQENLYVQGKVLEAERTHMQNLLRQSISMHPVDCDSNYILRLIDEAKAIRASVLTLDILQAEGYVRHYHALIDMSIKVQSKYRGDVARRLVKIMKKDHKLAKQKFQLTAKASGELAPTLIQEWVNTATKQYVKSYRKSLVCMAIDLSGVFCMVSVKRMARQLRKPIELCPSCRIQCKPGHNLSEKQKKPIICICPVIQGMERWQFIVYNPLTKVNKNLILSMDEVRTLLQNFEMSTRVYLTKQSIERRLIGDSFDVLEPLFQKYLISNKKFTHLPGSVWARSTLHAALESSVLMKLPTNIPASILEIVTLSSNPSSSLSLIDDNLISTWITSGGSPLTVKDIKIINDSGGSLPWNWEPFRDLEVSKLNEIRVQNQIQILQQNIQQKIEEVSYHQKSLLQYEKELDYSSLVHEDNRSKLYELNIKIEFESQKIKKVMNFAKNLHSSILRHETNELLDDRPSYDEKEDGHAWVGLNNLRKLEKLMEPLLYKFLSLMESFQQSLHALKNAKDLLKKKKDELMEAKINLSNYFPSIEKSKQLSIFVSYHVKYTIQTILTGYSMPRKKKPIDTRRLQIIPFHLIFIRHPLERLRWSNRKALSFLTKRILILKPLNPTLDGRLKSYLRCEAVVLRDPLTGYHVIQIGQDELSVEESVQHEDLQLEKKDFSDLTEHALDSDILLRPMDVEKILSTPITILGMRCTKYQHKLFILPSQRPRDINYFKIYPQPKRMDECSNDNYSQRFHEKEKKESETADKLLKYLRMQPHTGRPCLGLLHFHRRIEYSTRQILQCHWYQDLLQALPRRLNNEVGSYVTTIGRQEALSSIDFILRYFTVSLQFVHKKYSWTSSIVIPTDSFIESLSVNSSTSPFLLIISLCEIVNNQFSTHTMDYLLQHIDLILPGSIQSAWRSPFCKEHPIAVFQPSEVEVFRGPLYKGHRFISGFYFLVTVSKSAHDYIQITLQSPSNSQYWAHQYLGDDFRIQLKREELLALAASLCTDTSLMSRHGCDECQIKFMHNDQLCVLLPILFEMIHLDPSMIKERIHQQRLLMQENHSQESSNLIQKRQSVGNGYEKNAKEGMEIARFDVEIYQSDQKLDMELNVGLLGQRFEHLIQCYNEWVHHRFIGDNDITLSDHQVQRLLKKVSSYAYEERIESHNRFNISYQPNDINLQQVQIHSNIWKTFDLLNYYGDGQVAGVRYQLQHQMLYNEEGVEGAELKRKLKIQDSTVDFQSKSYDSVKSLVIHTNIDRTMLYFEVKKAHLSEDSRCLNLLQSIECEQMCQEDQIAYSIRFEMVKRELSNGLLMKRNRLQEHQQLQLLTKLNKLQQKKRQSIKLIDQVVIKFRKVNSQIHHQHAMDVFQNLCEDLKTLSLDKLDGAREAFEQVIPLHQIKLTADSIQTTILENSGMMDSFDGKQLLAVVQQHCNALVHHCTMQSNGVIIITGRINQKISSESLKDQQSSPFLKRIIENHHHWSAPTTRSLPRVNNIHHSINHSSNSSSGYRNPNRWHRLPEVKSIKNHHRNGFNQDLARASSQNLLVNPGTKKHSLSTRTLRVSDEYIILDNILTQSNGSVEFTLYDPSRIPWHMHAIYIPPPPLPSALSTSLDKPLEEGSIEEIYLDEISDRLVKLVISYGTIQLASEQLVQVTDIQIEAILDEVAKVNDLLLEVEKEIDRIESFNLVELIENIKLHSVQSSPSSDIDQSINKVTNDQVLIHLESSSINDKSGTWMDLLIPKKVDKVLPQLTDEIESLHQLDEEQSTSSSGSHDSGSELSEVDGDPITPGVENPNSSSPYIYGFYIPCDELYSPVAIRTSLSGWSIACEKYLSILYTTKGDEQTPPLHDEQNKVPYEELVRRDSLPGLIYYDEQYLNRNKSKTSDENDPVVLNHHNFNGLDTLVKKRDPNWCTNSRLSRLVYMYESFRGFRGNANTHGNDRSRKKSRMKVVFADLRKKEKTLPGGQDTRNFQGSLKGNVMFMVRYGEEDFYSIGSLLKDMYISYEPIRSLRLVKDGREKQWRIANHGQFCSIVESISSLLHIGFQMLFQNIHYDHSVSIKQVIPCSDPLILNIFRGVYDLTFFVRMMLVRFQEIVQQTKDTLRLFLITKESAQSQLNTMMEQACNSPFVLQQAFILDAAIAHHNEKVLLQFDHVMPESSEYLNEKYVKDILVRTNLRVGINQVKENDRSKSAHRLRDESTSNSLIDETTNDSWNDEDEENESILAAPTLLYDITVGHLMYSIYSIHCQSCCRPYSSCRIPGCGLIRGNASACDDYTEGIKLETKRFLLQTTTESWKTLFPSMAMDSVKCLDLEDEVQQEAEEDTKALQEEFKKNLLKIDYVSFMEETQSLITLQQLMVPTPLHRSIQPVDVLLAKGGSTVDQIVSRIDKMCDHYTSSSAASKYIKRMELDTNPLDSHGKLLKVKRSLHPNNLSNSPAKKFLHSKSAPESMNQDLHDSEECVRGVIPFRIIKALIGFNGHDARGNHLLASDLDSYRSSQTILQNLKVNHPALDELHSIEPTDDQRLLDLIVTDPQSTEGLDRFKSIQPIELSPMSTTFFDWISKRLKVHRPNLFETSFPDDHIQSIELQFDRLHCEGLVTFHERRGNVAVTFDVVIEIFHGVLSNASYAIYTSTTRPSGAVRYCNLSQLEHELVDGLTVLLYDVTSKVSRVIKLEDRLVHQLFAMLSADDSQAWDEITLKNHKSNPYATVAKNLLQHGSKCFQLSRIGSYCTGISIRMNEVMNIGKRNPKLSNAAKPSTPHVVSSHPIKQKPVTLRREVEVKTMKMKHQNRMNSIQNLLKSKK